MGVDWFSNRSIIVGLFHSKVSLIIISYSKSIFHNYFKQVNILLILNRSITLPVGLRIC